jgi:hypothetical protein
LDFSRLIQNFHKNSEKQKTEVELDSHLLVPKDEPKDSKGIQLRGSNKQQLRPSKQKKEEPEDFKEINPNLFIDLNKSAPEESSEKCKK